MFKCVAVTKLFLDCSKKIYAAVAVDDEIMLADMLFYK